ncbi:hypothetical protein STANM309S_02239 [Streptomyces tanashiensis]
MSTSSPAATVLRTEFRLFGREPAALFWVMLSPTVLLVILGLIPSFREASEDLGGRRVIDVYVPVSVLFALIMAGLQAMPPVLAAYRERRRPPPDRASTHPRPARALLAARLVAARHAPRSCILGARDHGAVGIAFGVTPCRDDHPVVGIRPRAACSPSRAPWLPRPRPCAAGVRAAKVATAVGPASSSCPCACPAGGWVPVQAMPDTRQRRPSGCSSPPRTTRSTDAPPGDRGRRHRVPPEGRAPRGAVRGGAGRRRGPYGPAPRPSPPGWSPPSARRPPPTAPRSPPGRARSSPSCAKGTANRAIAAELFISEATVKTHLTHIYGKLGVNDRASAVATGYERGILGGA